MAKPLVSIIIVNWNGKRYFKDCLTSLSKSSYKKVEVLFVDNASADDSASYVEKNFPKIEILQNEKNLGFAEGHEEAIRKAKGELILLLSTDTIIEKNVIEELVKGMNSQKKVGAVMPKLVMYPQKTLIDSVGSFFVMSGISYHFGREKNPDDPKYNKPMEVYSAKGACLLFRKDVLQKTGLFDKDYFAYFEETDLCHRIWLAGYSVLYWPYAFVYHKGGGASKQMVGAFIQFHSFKNRLLTYIKNLSLKNLFIVMPQILLIYQFFFIVRILTREFSIAFAVQRAILWNILHIGDILKRRRHIQQHIRRVSDDDFLPRVTRHIRLSYYYYLFRGLAYYKDE